MPTEFNRLHNLVFALALWVAQLAYSNYRLRRRVEALERRQDLAKTAR